VCSGKSFGKGVVLMGIPEVVVLALLAIFHGSNEGLGVTIGEGVAFKLAVVVVLVATAIAVDALSLSLLFTLVFLAETKVMVKVGPLPDQFGLLGFDVLVTMLQ